MVQKTNFENARHSSAIIMGFSIPKQKSYQNLHLFHLSLQQRVHANRKKKEEQEQEAYHIVPPVRCIMHKTT
jgi:hypothetical protein